MHDQFTTTTTMPFSTTAAAATADLFRVDRSTNLGVDSTTMTTINNDVAAWNNAAVIAWQTGQLDADAMNLIHAAWMALVQTTTSPTLPTSTFTEERSTPSAAVMQQPLPNVAQPRVTTTMPLSSPSSPMERLNEWPRVVGGLDWFSPTTTTTTTTNPPFVVPPPPIVVLRSVPAVATTTAALSMATTAVMSDADINASPNNYFTVFQRAFEIQDMPTMGGFEHPQLRHRYLPAILLYNAGLTVHRLALCSGSTGAYLRALELYQHGQAFLDQHHHKTDMNNAGGVGDATTIASPNGDGNDINNNEEECECRSLVLLRLALANNLGHCYSHLNHGTETRECLSFVATLFLSQFPTASSSSSVYSLASSSSSSFVCSTPQQQQQQQQQLCYGFGPRWSPEEYEFFHLSLYFALDRRLIWAPAA